MVSVDEGEGKWKCTERARHPRCTHYARLFFFLIIIHSTNKAMPFSEPGTMQEAGYREMNETLSLFLDIARSSQEAEMETQSRGRSDK